MKNIDKSSRIPVGSTLADFLLKEKEREFIDLTQEQFFDLTVMPSSPDNPPNSSKEQINKGKY